MLVIMMKTKVYGISLFPYQVEDPKTVNPLACCSGMRVPRSRWVYPQKHPNSQNFKALRLGQLLNHLLNMGEVAASTPVATPVEEI